MNGNNLLLDTNIVLYFLNGEKTLIPLFESKNLYLSFISQLELLSSRYVKEEEIIKIKQFISECEIIDITQSIKDISIYLRRNYSIKLPDCIIIATSIWLNMPFITADQDFKKIDEADIIFFER